MSINERVRELRKTYLHMTMEEFGKRVGIGKTAISKVENGENNLSDLLFSAICREFNVNPDWLRNGEGEMLLPTKSGVIGELQRRYSLDEFETALLEEFVELDPRQRHVLVTQLSELIEKAREKLGQPQGVSEDDENPRPSWLPDRPLGTPEGISEAEVAYEKRFGIASKTVPSASNTIDGSVGA